MVRRTVQPNILLIMFDDHAARAISAYGGGRNHTPNLDRIAQEGMRLDRCYVTNSICTPSGAAILTGTFNHVNMVTALDTHIDNRLPNVAKHLRRAKYQTSIFGKWHLGEGNAHEPRGFDEWAVLPGQGLYYDPVLIDRDGPKVHPGYVTNIITDMSLDFLSRWDRECPFFLMCHHKALHRHFVCDHKHETLYEDDLPLPGSFNDDYANRATAAAAAKMRIRADMTYEDMGLVQPEGGREMGRSVVDSGNNPYRCIPELQPGQSITLIDAKTGETCTFSDPQMLAEFKYQRYIKRYLRTIQSVDDNVGRLLDYLDQEGIADNTIVIYTSDQGFSLGEHGWFDKHFMYEESLQMPFLVRYPAMIATGQVSKDIAMNADFAPTFLDCAGLTVSSYMQGASLRPLLEGTAGDDWQDVAYHRYWVHKDEYHNAYAHYGIRTQRYKLVYWYNDPMEQLGAKLCDDGPEWELFGCEADPFELHNRADDPDYSEIFRAMLDRLDRKMAEIGDVPQHNSQALRALLTA